MGKQLAWIGLGNMGAGMCKNLVEKGELDNPLILYNRTKSRADDLAAKLGDKSIVASTIGEVVSKADIIFTCLGDDPAVLQTLETMLESDISGKLLVDCSTVHPATTRQLAEVAGKKAASFVACPVFGVPAMAEAGQLICVLAGAAEDVDRVRPYCKGVMGRANIEFVDNAPEKAVVMKLLGNGMILQMVESVAEAHTLAEKTELGNEQMHQFIEAMFPGPYTAYSKRMMEGDYYKRDRPLFAVDLALKDAGHILDLAANSGTRIKAVEVVQQHLKEVKEHAGAKGDLPGIYGAVRLESGLEYENGPK